MLNMFTTRRLEESQKPRKRSRRGFTLIELLVVIAIIALLVSILLPSLNAARELAKRAVCGASLNGLGKAVSMYASEHNGAAPVAPSKLYQIPAGAPHCQWGGQIGAFRVDEPTTSDDTSTTASQWLLVKGDYAAVKLFICPSTDNDADDMTDSSGTVQDMADLYDFKSANTINYSFQMPYGMHLVTTMSPGGLGLAADRSPWFNTPDGSLAADKPTAAEDDETNNSHNHDQEGQNVLFVDSHVAWSQTTNVGINDDHIYTRYRSAGAGSQGNPKIGVISGDYAIVETDDTMLAP